MRSTSPRQHHIGAERGNQVARAYPTRVRGQFGPEATNRVFPLLRPISAGHGKRQNSWADVVLGLTTLPLTVDGEARSSEHPLNPLLQFLTTHSVHLQLPITRSYLLLQRTLRHGRRRRRPGPPPPRAAAGVKSPGSSCRGLSARPGLLEAGVEVLAQRLASGRSARPKLSRGWGENPWEGHGQPAPAQGPLPHAGHVTVAGEADLPRLGEAEPHPACSTGSAAQPVGPAPARRASAPPPTGGPGSGRPTPGPDPSPGSRPAGGTGEATTCSSPKPGAGPAVVAWRPAAVLHPCLGQGVLPVGPEEVAVQPGRDVIPRQRLVFVPVAVGHLGQAQPLRRQGLLPQREVETLGPLLECAPGPPHPLDHRAHTTVAPAGHALGRRCRRLVPADGEPPGGAGLLAQQVDLALQLVDRVLAEPLEGRVRLGDEPPTEATTVTDLEWRRPISTQCLPSSAMPMTSSSRSVGSPIRK